MRQNYDQGMGFDPWFRVPRRILGRNLFFFVILILLKECFLSGILLFRTNFQPLSISPLFQPLFFLFYRRYRRILLHFRLGSSTNGSAKGCFWKCNRLMKAFLYNWLCLICLSKKFWPSTTSRSFETLTVYWKIFEFELPCQYSCCVQSRDPVSGIFSAKAVLTCVLQKKISGFWKSFWPFFSKLFEFS